MSQGGFQVGFNWKTCQLVIRQAAPVGAVEYDIPFSKRQQVAQMAATDRAQSSDKESHLFDLVTPG
jgi:hypothetical protein